ncbi:CRISPR-associated helicase Cas3' [Frankia sp. AiPa1]|uniref:CRISPR-associated helicase Cas3' n=1 Tax=Frankia sp. AiPa1 TaxID=573492 RepID=UPI00202B60D4|nr:CRISPR-associated helicase Cas3' [Frankia sp. AiPa1]MCL9760947.1 CRISPR-associated helicase Cas3' [Frankia sp. AiPa1]
MDLGRLAVLWAKGDKPPAWHPLWAHAIDAGATADWLWRRGMTPAARHAVARLFPGGAEDGRLLLCWLAALHDLGKASPGFQFKNAERAAVTRTRLSLPEDLPGHWLIPHAWVSASCMVRMLEGQHGWSRARAHWPAMLVGGHHGKFPDQAIASLPRRWPHLCGDGEWAAAQSELFTLLTEHLGVTPRLAAWRDVQVPPQVQMMLAGWVMVADWLASSEPQLGNETGPFASYPQRAADRAETAAQAAGWGRLWTPVDVPREADQLFLRRFGLEKIREVQARAVDLAWSVPGPALFVVEAPTGEGKTELALAVAEVLAARFGAGGLFFGLPTQATADQAFGRVKAWLAKAGGGGITLAHGKARWNEQFAQLLAQGRMADVGSDCDDDAIVEAHSWYQGRHRPLLAPVAVGTIDQVLFAATRSRFVAMRHAALAGKIVVLDEVHAYSAYMSVFLRRALQWLGAAGVPVLLLSATLPADTRRALAQAYAGGEVHIPRDATYPGVLAMAAPGHESPPGPRWVMPARCDSAPARLDRRVARLEWLDEPVGDSQRQPGTDRRRTIDQRRLVDLLTQRLDGGGCALVIRNTVDRAQQTYEAMRVAFGAKRVLLLHAQFTLADRLAGQQKLVSLFGPRAKRPDGPFVVVATQIAEQSLDIDLDLLVSDLAPLDLLFQRLGRTHRHQRDDRRPRVATPSLIVTGLQRAEGGGVPAINGGSIAIYSEHLLLRTVAVLHGRHDLDLPAEVPDLIDAVYGDRPVGPASWQDDLAAAHAAHLRELEDRQSEAERYLLASVDEVSAHGHLGQVHQWDIGTAAEDDDPQVTSHVRDGTPTLEALLLRTDSGGTARLPSGAAVPLDARPRDALLDELLLQACRLPRDFLASPESLTRPAKWRHHPWLRHHHVLTLPADGSPRRVGGRSFVYTEKLGLGPKSRRR